MITQRGQSAAPAIDEGLQTMQDGTSGCCTAVGEGLHATCRDSGHCPACNEGLQSASTSKVVHSHW